MSFSFFFLSSRSYISEIFSSYSCIIQTEVTIETSSLKCMFLPFKNKRISGVAYNFSQIFQKSLQSRSLLVKLRGLFTLWERKMKFIILIETYNCYLTRGAVKLCLIEKSTSNKNYSL